MSQFEKITRIDASLNGHPAREKVFNIEKSDEDYKLVYKPPVIADMTPAQFDKYQKAKKIAKDTKVIDLNPKKENKASKKKV